MLVGALTALTPSATAAQRVVTWDLHSKYVTKTQALTGLAGYAKATAGPTGLRSWVVLPDGYTRSHCWPVLYLLHAAGTVHEWVSDAAAYENLHAIVVVPGGGDSQFTNWWNGGQLRPAFESWFFDELMPKVSHSFPICQARRYHAIAGSSMGGYGAMYLAAQRPDYFGTAASFSGVIATSDPVIQYGYAAYQDVWGPPGGFYALGHDPVELLPALKHTRLFVYRGTAAPANSQDIDTGNLKIVEAVMRHEADVFVAAARRDHVTVHLTTHAGIHDQLNWNTDLSDLIVSDPFGAVAPLPGSWRYITTASRGLAWNWRYTFRRPPATLEVFSFSDGTLRGMGSGRVTMASTVTGQQFTTTLPFMFRNGQVSSSGHRTVPVTRPTALPVPITLGATTIKRGQLLPLRFTTARALNGNEIYQLTANQSFPKCMIDTTTRIEAPRKHQTVSFRLRPGRGSGHPANHWCKGDGLLALQIVDKRNPAFQISTLVGEAFFRAR